MVLSLMIIKMVKEYKLLLIIKKLKDMKVNLKKIIMMVMELLNTLIMIHMMVNLKMVKKMV